MFDRKTDKRKEKTEQTLAYHDIVQKTAVVRGVKALLGIMPNHELTRKTLDLIVKRYVELVDPDDAPGPKETGKYYLAFFKKKEDAEDEFNELEKL